MFRTSGIHRAARHVATAVTATTTAAITAFALLSAPTAGAQPLDEAAFYDTTTLVPGEPGSVLRSQGTPLVMSHEAVGVPPRATRVIYSSRTVFGDPVAVSGVLVEPTATWDGPGPRPTLVFGRGTNGQGDQCAPSRNWPYGGQPSPLESGRRVALEGLLPTLWATQGVRVFTPDYIGLGTPGMHTYTVREDQAHAMIDGARAALAVASDGEPAGPVAFWGHSQGGAASAAAAELVSSYAPELDAVGAYASAPPANLISVARHVDGSTLTGATGFTINSLRSRYPVIERILEENLNEAGWEMLEQVKTMCTNDLRDAIGTTPSSEWTRTGERLSTILARYPEVVDVLEQQRVGRIKPEIPVMVVAGDHDTIVEPGQVYRLAESWCALGADVHFRTDPLPPLFDENHTIQAVSSGPQGSDFLLKLFRSQPVGPNTCAAAP